MLNTEVSKARSFDDVGYELLASGRNFALVKGIVFSFSAVLNPSFLYALRHSLPS